MSFAKMLPSPWQLPDLPATRVREQPPEMVLHARLGLTAVWVTRLIERKGCDRQYMARVLLRFRQLFVPCSASALDENFTSAAYMLAHPLEYLLEDALTVAHTTVLDYVDYAERVGSAEGGQDAFEAAVRMGNIEAAKQCTVALVDMSDMNGTTPLMLAAREGHSEMVSWLLAVGADPSLRDMFGETYRAHGVPSTSVW